MNEFIYNVDRIIKEEEKAFKHASDILVYDTKWGYLTAIIERLSAYKRLLIPLTYGTMKNTEARKRYDEISDLYNKVSDARSAMLPDSGEDVKRSEARREATRKKYGIA